MDSSDKDRLRARLARAGQNEPTYAEKKLAKQRSVQRKSGCGRPRARGRFDAQDETEHESVDTGAPLLRRQAPTRAATTGASLTPLPINGPGLASDALVVGIERARLSLRSASGSCFARATPRTAGLAVGDRVAFEPADASYVRITMLRPRKSRLARPDPGSPGRELVLAANVDLALIVVTATHPPPKPGLIDRLLVALQVGGIAPLLCVNKIDLVADSAQRAGLEALLAPYAALGCSIAYCSATARAGLDAVHAHVRGRCCVLVGHSGVGKSSLLNALDPSARRSVGDVRATDGRGRHTTSNAALREVGAGTSIIDTPGVRQFGLLRIPAAELANYFREFDGPSRACRFRDCTHVVEPDCGVQHAVERGEIPRARYESYLRVWNSERE